MFLLARIATLQAVQSSHDPRVLAWSHIYGRILDIQENETAVEHYRLGENEVGLLFRTSRPNGWIDRSGTEAEEMA